MPDGAIAIHIKADWLLSNISVFNEVRGQKTDSIVILGQKGEIIAGELGNAEFLPVIQNEFGSMEDNGEQGEGAGNAIPHDAEKGGSRTIHDLLYPFVPK
ncbi:MAG: hypothetical protein ACLSA0_07830 [Eisenbergiella massiliensis]